MDSKTSFAAILIFIFALLVYFLPTMVASSREIRASGGVFVLNLLLGWTFLGWVIALVWAVAGERKASAAQAPQGSRVEPTIDPRPTRRCPFCAEEILLAAVKCKHCGSDLQASAAR